MLIHVIFTTMQVASSWLFPHLSTSAFAAADAEDFEDAGRDSRSDRSERPSVWSKMLWPGLKVTE
jgi:hypothetical protein